MFDTKIAIVVRDDLATWQKLNVTAFLMSGIAGANPDLIGEPYRDRDGKPHLPMSVQPVIVLSGAANVLTNIPNIGSRLACDLPAIGDPTMMSSCPVYLDSNTLYRASKVM